jgi:hypothetical protein
VKYPGDWYSDANLLEHFLSPPIKPVFVGHWSNLPIEGPRLEDLSRGDDMTVRLLVYKASGSEKSLESYAIDKNSETILEKRGFKTKLGLSGQQFYVVTTDHPSGVKGIFTVFENDQTVIIFKSNWGARDIHNQILSTFKFIE